MANRWLSFLAPTPTIRSKPPDGGAAVLTVEVAGRDVPIAVRRLTRAKRFTLRLSARGDSASVTMPKRGTLAEARAFLDRHIGWLEQRLAAPSVRSPVIDGSSIPLRGVPHVIRLSGTARGTVRASLDAEGNAVLTIPGAPEHAARRLADQLKSIARADLHAAVRRHSAAIGVTPARIRLKDTTSRWGSASTSGTLSFSWRLALAPPFVLDYLAAHEVAHLREMNHSARFWAICRRLAPRTDEARAWLKKHGAELHRMI